MVQTEAAALKIEALSKTYHGLLPWARNEVKAVRDLTLELGKGEIFGLLGPNGAGKTTSIKMIAGLVEPDSGRISFPAFSGRPAIGAVLEGSRNLYWRLSAWENIRYFGEIKGVPLAVLNRQARELLELFGLTEKRDRPAQTLSRGMQQKLAVVLALLGTPELLLLDEPTLGLDVASSITIQQMLKQLCRERQLTIILTTHQMDVAQTMCRRVGIMRDGQIAACEMVDHLVDHFKRQDYLARMTAKDWSKLQPGFSGFAHELVEEDRPGQVSCRVKLKAARELYGLMTAFEEAGVELLDFSQEVPTLEDVFLSITETGASDAAMDDGGDS